MKRFWIAIFALMLSACAAAPVDNNPRPAWIDSPGDGVSASAGTHVKGRVAQEELAIARARVEFAKRFGVAIDAGQTTATQIANGRSSTVSNSVSTEETRQQDVKAVVKAKWLDVEKDVLWVWLVPAN